MNNRIRNSFDKITPPDYLLEKTKNYIEYNKKLVVYKKKNNVIMKRILPICASFVFVVLLGINFYFSPTGYLDFDINPSFEIKVNALNRVIDYDTFNQDGEDIVKKIDVFNMKIEDAALRTLYVLTDDGYLSQNGENEILFTMVTDSSAIKYEIAIDDAIENYSDETGIRINSSKQVLSMKEYNNKKATAIYKGVSPGKVMQKDKLEKNQSKTEVEPKAESTKQPKKNSDNDNINKTKGNNKHNINDKPKDETVKDEKKNKEIKASKKQNKNKNHKKEMNTKNRSDKKNVKIKNKLKKLILNNIKKLDKERTKLEKLDAQYEKNQNDVLLEKRKKYVANMEKILRKIEEDNQKLLSLGLEGIAYDYTIPETPEITPKKTKKDNNKVKH